MKLQLKGEEVLGVVSKIPNLGRLQVFKAVRIILSGNPEEFSLLKSLPDVEKTEWILLLISQSEGKEESLRYAIPSGHVLCLQHIKPILHSELLGFNYVVQLRDLN
ncbi:uncharacterized protein Pyn_31628 [Prunus yedoensis var. nudiflora]|uniref:Uncharacterized protein n=1 Tax=Prunus yedoensis var. nudiflora TaxID=2094558 RepID=A0A314UTH6_PRUYE|nr:uncharacterized protein Pyn_31628 [Prunus yedoensis var. nudiflora]